MVFGRAPQIGWENIMSIGDGGALVGIRDRQEAINYHAAIQGKKMVEDGTVEGII